MLVIGDSFDESIDEVEWPPTLEEVVFGRSMSIESALEADWTAAVSLRALAVGGLDLVRGGEWLVDLC